MDLNTVTETYAEQFGQLREQMLSDRLKELMGPDIRPAEFEGRLHACYFPDRLCQIKLDGKTILQVEGLDMANNMACIWKTANFRTA